MTSVVIDLAAYRGRRAQGKGCSESRPPDNVRDHLIQLRYQPDGSYAAKIAGIYAEDPTLALRAMVDATQRLGGADPSLAIRLMAEAIGNLAVAARA